MVPQGHGEMLWDDEDVDEGSVDSSGRMQGQWVRKKAGGRKFASFQCDWGSYQCAEDVRQADYTGPPRPPRG